MHRDGWAVITTVRILESQQNKGMLIFRTCEPLKMEYMCVSLNEIDKIRTINAPEDITAHVREMVHYCWEYGTKHDIEKFGVREIRLRVRPWGNRFNDAMHARYLMMQVLNRLLLLRYQLVLSADFTSQFVRSRPLDVDSWWLARVYEDPEELKRKMIELAIQQRPYLERVLLMEEYANGNIPGGSGEGSVIQSIDDINSSTPTSLE